MNTPYIGAAEAAKSVRRVLKARFPGVAFSVRTKHGTEIRIAWTDGPSEAQVKPHTWGFGGREFDGMIDLAYSSDSWYNPHTGEAAFARTFGTYGNGGSNPPAHAPNPWPGAGYLVCFSASVSWRRSYSPETLEIVAGQVIDKYGYDRSSITIKCFAPDTRFEEWAYEFDPTFPALERDRFFRALREYTTYTEPEPAPDPAPDLASGEPVSKVDGGGIKLEHDRDWTWAYLDEEPGDWLETALKAQGFKHSPRRSARGGCPAWYARERVDLLAVVEILRAAYWKDYRTAHPDDPNGDPDQPLGPGGGPSYGQDRRETVKADYQAAQALVCGA